MYFALMILILNNCNGNERQTIANNSRKNGLTSSVIDPINNTKRNNLISLPPSKKNPEVANPKSDIVKQPHLPETKPEDNPVNLLMRDTVDLGAYHSLYISAAHVLNVIDIKSLDLLNKFIADIERAYGEEDEKKIAFINYSYIHICNDKELSDDFKVELITALIRNKYFRINSFITSDTDQTKKGFPLAHALLRNNWKLATFLLDNDIDCEALDLSHVIVELLNVNTDESNGVLARLFDSPKILAINSLNRKLETQNTTLLNLVLNANNEFAFDLLVNKYEDLLFLIHEKQTVEDLLGYIFDSTKNKHNLYVKLLNEVKIKLCFKNHDAIELFLIKFNGLFKGDKINEALFIPFFQDNKLIFSDSKFKNRFKNIIYKYIIDKKKNNILIANVNKIPKLSAIYVDKMDPNQQTKFFEPAIKNNWTEILEAMSMRLEYLDFAMRQTDINIEHFKIISLGLGTDINKTFSNGDLINHTALTYALATNQLIKVGTLLENPNIDVLIGHDSRGYPIDMVIGMFKAHFNTDKQREISEIMNSMLDKLSKEEKKSLHSKYSAQEVDIEDKTRNELLKLISDQFQK